MGILTLMETTTVDKPVSKIVQEVKVAALEELKDLIAKGDSRDRPRLGAIELAFRISHAAYLESP